MFQPFQAFFYRKNVNTEQKALGDRAKNNNNIIWYIIELVQMIAYVNENRKIMERIDFKKEDLNENKI